MCDTMYAARALADPVWAPSQRNDGNSLSVALIDPPASFAPSAPSAPLLPLPPLPPLPPPLPALTDEAAAPNAATVAFPTTNQVVPRGHAAAAAAPSAPRLASRRSARRAACAARGLVTTTPRHAAGPPAASRSRSSASSPLQQKERTGAKTGEYPAPSRAWRYLSPGPFSSLQRTTSMPASMPSSRCCRIGSSAQLNSTSSPLLLLLAAAACCASATRTP